MRARNRATKQVVYSPRNRWSAQEDALCSNSNAGLVFIRKTAATAGGVIVRDATLIGFRTVWRDITRNNIAVLLIDARRRGTGEPVRDARDKIIVEIVLLENRKKKKFKITGSAIICFRSSSKNTSFLSCCTAASDDVARQIFYCFRSDSYNITLSM